VSSRHFFTERAPTTRSRSRRNFKYLEYGQQPKVEYTLTDGRDRELYEDRILGHVPFEGINGSDWEEKEKTTTKKEEIRLYGRVYVQEETRANISFMDFNDWVSTLTRSTLKCFQRFSSPLQEEGSVL